MRIGLSGRTTDMERVAAQAVQAEKDGFTSLWYAGGAGGDSLLAIAFAGRATTTIELGTAIVQTYPCHPVLQATRALAVAEAVGDGRLVLGVGPSHEPNVHGVLGLSYARPGQHVEEYLRVLDPLLRREGVDFDGEEIRVHAPAQGSGAPSVSVLVAALGPRLLRLAGELADGTILWLANARAIASHVVPRVNEAAARAGRPDPRVVAGLPVAVHDDVDEAREVVARRLGIYGRLTNYQRILAHGEVESPAEAAVVGDEASVTAQLEAMLAAGATDIWADVFPVGDDRSASRTRTLDLLGSLVAG